MGKSTSYKRRKPKNPVAHTKDDKRYKRSNHIRMMKCPLCSSKSLFQCSDQGMVWVNCSSCGKSGYNERLSDNHLMEAVDIATTITDANP